MITPHFYLCALPGEAWKQALSWNSQEIAISTFVEDALGIERRIKRGVNADNERTRYSLCCARIEAAIPPPLLTQADTQEPFAQAVQTFRLPFCTLGPDYLHVLAMMVQQVSAQAAELRVGASFFPPEMVQAHSAGFQQLAQQLGMDQNADVQRRIRFFQLASQNGCGVVEMQDTSSTLPGEASATLLPAQAPEASPTIPITDVEGEEELPEGEKRKLLDILRHQLEEAIGAAREGRAVAINFSNYPHNVITEALREFAYKESDADTLVSIQVLYTDGSQGAPFHLRCLAEPAEGDLADLRCTPPLRVALMSMRHLAMDHDVDMAWFRNAEVSKARTFAETDDFCYQQTRKQLHEAQSEGPLVMHLGQTGLQPAVIGFYRALVEELLDRAAAAPSLEVVPYYFRRNGGYLEGQLWH